MEEDIPRHEMKIAFFGRGFKKGKLFYLWCKKEITPGALQSPGFGANRDAAIICWIIRTQM